MIKDLEFLFASFDQYLSLKDIKSIYKDLHVKHQSVLRKVLGFNLLVATSSVLGVGQGVFIDHGYAKRGSVVGLYP